jgi:hypothetical protein
MIAIKSIKWAYLVSIPSTGERENYKTWLKKIKEEIDEWKTFCVHGLDELI